MPLNKLFPVGLNYRANGIPINLDGNLFIHLCLGKSPEDDDLICLFGVSSFTKPVVYSGGWVAVHFSASSRITYRRT